jgi:hypothetical membrane protein
VNRRTARLGALAWVVGTVQFFVVHLVVQSRWHSGYSWSRNNISDLGDVYCSDRGDPARYVCSPLHAWMSGSFVVHGILIVAGALLLRRAGYELLASRSAVTLLGVAGLGWIVVGLAPADVAESLHVAGATAGLLGGALALVAAALVPRHRGWQLLRTLWAVLGRWGWPRPCCSASSGISVWVWVAWSVSPLSR